VAAPRSEQSRFSGCLRGRWRLLSEHDQSRRAGRSPAPEFGIDHVRRRPLLVYAYTGHRARAATCAAIGSATELKVGRPPLGGGHASALRGSDSPRLRCPSSSIQEGIGGLALACARSVRATTPGCLLLSASQAIGKHLATSIAALLAEANKFVSNTSRASLSGVCSTREKSPYPPLFPARRQHL
jgi:hypothetical protein